MWELANTKKVQTTNGIWCLRSLKDFNFPTQSMSYQRRVEKSITRTVIKHQATSI